jgi:NhaA family Na+:H+ antiporter
MCGDLDALAVGRRDPAERPNGGHGSERGVFSLREFLHDEAFGGILLLACAVAALVWANSSWDYAYNRLWNAELAIGTDRFGLALSLSHWINDGLMALFFVVVGFEI